MQDELAQDMQERLRVRESPAKSAPPPRTDQSKKAAQAAKTQEATVNLKRAFEGFRELRKQWEDRAASQNGTPHGTQHTKDTHDHEASVNSPSAKQTPKADSNKAEQASGTESKRFCEVTGLNYRVYGRRKGTVNQLRIRELYGTKGVAELKANSLLGKRAAEFDMDHVYDEDESSFEVILGPKRPRTGEASTANNRNMSGPQGEARHEQ
jgi:hypothetical protein